MCMCVCSMTFSNGMVEQPNVVETPFPYISNRTHACCTMLIMMLLLMLLPLLLMLLFLFPIQSSSHHHRHYYHDQSINIHHYQYVKMLIISMSLLLLLIQHVQQLYAVNNKKEKKKGRTFTSCFILSFYSATKTNGKILRKFLRVKKNRKNIHTHKMLQEECCYEV